MTEGQNPYCVKICVLSSPTLNSCFHFFPPNVYVGFRRVRLSILDCLKWKGWTREHDGTTQSDTKQSDKQWTRMTLDASPLSLKIYVLRNCSWSDVRCRANSMSTPWGKTYIHETESHRLAVCVGMALQDITVPRSFCKHGVLLNLPAREGWNAWKHHYCALTWPTVNGWVKVPFEMYDVKKKKKKKSTRKPSPCIMLHTLGKVNIPTVELTSNIFACCQLTVQTVIQS